MSKPFVKWVGGKRQILPVLLKNLPVSVKELNEKEGVYIEPFLGGGAVFFALQKQGLKKAFLNDTNAELMNVYRVVQQVADTLSATLERDNFKNEKEAYLSVRDWDRDENWPYNKSDIERAARFIYLNKMGYNGLYRVNKKGQFNVPFGRYDRLNLPSKEELLAAQQALLKTSVDFTCMDFEKVCRFATPNDLIYFDPPYIPLSPTSSFVGYTPDGFNQEMQENLAKVCRDLTERNVPWLLSNSSAELSHQLFGSIPGVETIEISASRHINSDPDKRKEVKELMFSFSPHKKKSP